MTNFSESLPESEDLNASGPSKSFDREKKDHFVFNERVLLQALYNNSASTYYILDADMRILWANSEAQNQTLKYIGRDVIIGESIFNYTNPAYYEDFKQRIQKVVTTKVSDQYERQTFLPDGSSIWTFIQLKPLLDVSGNFLAVSLSGTDITEQKNSQSKVKEIEQTLSALFDSLGQPYTLFDMKRRISWFNLKAREESVELFGHDIEIGLSFSDIIPSSYVPVMEGYFNRVYNGETITYERNYPHRLGLWKQIVLGPVKDGEGNIMGMYVTSKDISELKLTLYNSMSNEFKMKAIFDTSSDYHALFSEDNKLIWANKEALKVFPLLFGKELNIGDDIQNFAAPEYKTSLLEYIEKARSGATVTYERLYPLVKGRKMWLNISISGVQYSEDKNKMGVSFIVKDITDHKEYEERLTQVNKELVDQNQQLNQFSYIVSHNLRGPIASLMGLTTMLERELKDTVQSDIVQGYKVTVQRFDEIINDLTNILTQTNEADKTKSKISLADEFANVLDLQRGVLAQLDVSLSVDFSAPHVVGVKSFVHSILLNLLSNSIKYRKDDVKLEIKVNSSYQNDKVLIEFTDNGMGINLDMYHDKLFNFYKRFHSHVEGKGLGLYLVKTQVELMGGKINVKSKVGEGTTFYIYLPKPIVLD